MCSEGLCPLAAVSVQGTQPHQAQVFRVRGVASCDVGHLSKPPKSTQDQAPTTACAAKVGFSRRSERARHATAPTTGISRAQCRFMRRGPALQADQKHSRPSADNGMCSNGLVFLAAVSMQDTLLRRPHASNSCSAGHSAHSRLLGVIIPQAQEFAILDSVYRGLVGVLIRGPCLEQSASLQLCVWYTPCR